ncbi:hypothetical protein BD410DRAFT_138952 [Rickenella mellea]|uniref:Uncharacterized protein n=1 Tax=Rickenella mellea TaxID=50990 RepID=A0A4Y7PJQ6_9AGAM|nr:hypothetical protein BD410DRAFT_138952 [Rickenella mellea]
MDPALLPGKPTKNVYSIDSSQVNAGGFGFLADRSDVGGKASKGHRSIAIKKPFTPTALLHALNALPWKKEPDAPKPTKTPAPRAIAQDTEAEPTEPATSTVVALQKRIIQPPTPLRVSQIPVQRYLRGHTGRRRGHPLVGHYFRQLALNLLKKHPSIPSQRKA